MWLIALLNKAPGRLIPLCLALHAVAIPAEELAAALAAGRVGATFSATGGSSGDAMTVTLRKLGGEGDSIPLTIRPGTRLKSGSADEQDMFIGGVRGIEMGGEYFAETSAIEAGATPQTYILDAYCAEIEKDNPSAGGGYTLAKVDSIIGCILSRGGKHTVAAKQAAVWIQTDQATFDQVSEKIPIRKSEWTSAVALARQCQKAGQGSK